MPAALALAAADSTGPFDLINGIPVHPLVVHAAVVLVPLAALGVLAMAIVPRLSRTLGWLVALGALAATGACWVAKEAGEQLAARVGSPGFDHQSLGSWMPFFAAALAIAAIVLWLVDRRRIEDRPAPRGTLGIVVAVLAGIIAVANLVWVYQVGDSGARSVWSGRVAVTEPTPSPTPTPTPTPSQVAPGASATPSASVSPGVSPAVYTTAQVGTHNAQGDCWAAIEGSVYDLTTWISRHPGGADRIIALCGTDATAAFTTQHDDQPTPNDQLAQFRIGTLGP